jgi:hypothetical protein
MKIWIFYLKNYRVIHHFFMMFTFIVVFKIGGINLLIIDIKMLPLQLFLLIICYPITNFLIKYCDLESSIEKEKKERGI